MGDSGLNAPSLGDSVGLGASGMCAGVSRGAASERTCSKVAAQASRRESGPWSVMPSSLRDVAMMLVRSYSLVLVGRSARHRSEKTDFKDENRRRGGQKETVVACGFQRDTGEC